MVGLDATIQIGDQRQKVSIAIAEITQAPADRSLFEVLVVAQAKKRRDDRIRSGKNAALFVVVGHTTIISSTVGVGERKDIKISKLIYYQAFQRLNALKINGPLKAAMRTGNKWVIRSLPAKDFIRR